ncbi:uncharacterized protein LOC101864574 [Aplysia californica]|uniref:Uncharacterized protein LOC101864574 n=1 Tax=Aplysia californica TaxID=6500 RepID=A0ABM0JBB3_APLCA|nr:uncharacterized protein LOC101864574 [Aplysia californica]
MNPQLKNLASIVRRTSHVVGALRQGSLKSQNFVRCAGSQANSGSGKPISRFPVPDLDSVPEDLRQLMQENLDKAGFIPNVFQTLSHRPAELRAFVAYYEAVMNDREGGNISKADKELIIVAVSALNHCRYCIIAHGALFRIFSKHTTLADQVAANWKTADLDDRQRAILEFALEVAQCQPLQDSHFQALYQQGLNEEDAWDIGAVVALFSLSNRMAFLTEMAPNEEFYMLGRIPKKPKE